MQFVMVVVVGLALLGCKKSMPTEPTDNSTATPPVLLSVGSPTEDEDPSVLRAQDGSLLIAWFSDRGGNSDIYISRSQDGATWPAPTRVTILPFGDFYPNLIQGTDGTFHLVWFSWVTLAVGQIRYSSSRDGVTWTSHEAVTTEFLVDDWVPTITEAPGGGLLVYFVSAKRDQNRTADIYVVSKATGATVWSPAAKVAGINSLTEHDHLPFVARTGAVLTMTWVRYDTSDPDFITNPKSALYLATSTDGRAWSTPAKVTTETGKVVNLFPELYQHHDGSWYLMWLSTRSGVPRVWEIPLASAGRYPAGLVLNSNLPDGYSHRMVATKNPGEYLAVWVEGVKGSRDVYYRYLKR